jgi:hypothetical protein
MKLTGSLKTFIATFASSAMLLACAAPATQPKTTNMPDTTASTTAEKPNVSTFCLGRFLIDLPAGSALSGGNYKYEFKQIERPVAMNLEIFQTEIKALEEKRRTAKHEIEVSLLRAIQKPNDTSAVMAYWEEFSSAGIVQVDGYKWVNGTRFLIKAEAGTSKPKEGTGTRQDLVMTRINEIITHIRPRPDTDIPTEPGYCFGGGFIANPKLTNEEVNVDIDIAGHPDAFISVWIFPLASHKHDKPLLTRMGGALQAVARMANPEGRLKVLREGERALGAPPVGKPAFGAPDTEFAGQEHLMAATHKEGMHSHAFVWETQGKGRLDTPFIEIKLTTGHPDAKGNPQKTKLSDEQALKLWDQIISTFRLRPVTAQPTKTSAVDPNAKPLGERAITGRICPQTGWWQATDTQNQLIANSPPKRIEAGESMPKMQVQDDPSWWQKLTAQQPSSYDTITVWQLVSYEDPGVQNNQPPTPPSTANS